MFQIVGELFHRLAQQPVSLRFARWGDKAGRRGVKLQTKTVADRCAVGGRSDGVASFAQSQLHLLGRERFYLRQRALEIRSSDLSKERRHIVASVLAARSKAGLRGHYDGALNAWMRLERGFDLSWLYAVAA